MRTKILLLCAGAIFFFALNAHATLIFSDDFEGDLSAWVGKGGSPATHHGQIVADPHNAANNVLNFNGLNAGGDIFTSASFFVPGTYWLSFDYLGRTSTGDSGGYVGISQGFAGTHRWLWATGTVSGAQDVLIDDGDWHSYLFQIPSLYTFHLMLEEFSGSDNIIGNAYFDNIKIYNSKPVPEPTTMLLLGAALAGLTAVRRKKFLRK